MSEGLSRCNACIPPQTRTENAFFLLPGLLYRDKGLTLTVGER